MRLPILLATLALLAAACPSETPRGPASVAVRDYSGPAAGVDVVFHNPDGTVLAHLLTDAAGRASAVVEAGALVTVARFQPGSTDEWRLATVAGVEPGDMLVLEPPPAGSAEVVGSASVSYSGALTGTDQYSVTLACTGSSWAYTPDPVTVPLFPSCGTSVDAIGIAHNGSTGMVGWATATGIPVTGTSPGMTASVDLGAWRTDVGTLGVTLTNPPASAVSVTGALRPRRGGQLWPSATDGRGASVAPPAATSIALLFAKDFWSSGRLELTVWHEGYDATTFIVNESALADRTVDLASALPPRLSGASLTETATGYAASWTRAAADPGLDGTVLIASWADGAIHRWRVVLPPGLTGFAFPTLPAALAAWLPAPGQPLDSVIVNTHDLSTVSSYRAFRNEHLLFLEEVAPEAGDWTLRSSQTITVP